MDFVDFLSRHQTSNSLEATEGDVSTETNVETHLGGALRSDVIPVFRICDPWLATVQVLNGQLVLATELRELRLEIFVYERIDFLRRLVRNETR